MVTVSENKPEGELVQMLLVLSDTAHPAVPD